MNQVQRSYQNSLKRKRMFSLIVFLSLLVFIIMGLLIGPSDIDFSDVWNMLRGSESGISLHIVLQLRLPRILAAIISGTALAVSGAVMQSVLRNPLGSPFTLGISNAAAFGAAFAVILFGAGDMHSGLNDSLQISRPFLITLSAFAWSMAACMLILFVAKVRGASPENMILTGIIASSLFAAFTTALQYIADDIELAAIVFWTFGDLSKGSWNEIGIQSLILFPLIFYFMRNRWNYNALDSGDETAQSLGVNISKLRLRSMVAASLATAAVVSFYGIIAFAGLVVPHIVRRIIGGNERFLLPASAFTGAAFLLICDILARSLVSPLILPVGILTSIIGAPLFILLLLKGIGRSQWK